MPDPIIIVETGCLRIKDNFEGDGQSTLLFDVYTQFRGKGSKVYTVDINPIATKNCSEVVSKNVNIKDCWILQILDSTTNFSRGIDNFFISISLKENGNINICALYNPIKDENLCFQNGSGGYKNDYRIRVSETKRLNNSISSFFATKTETDANIILGEIRQIMKKNNIETRESGSIMHEISLIACGKTDCLFFPELDKDINNQISLILSETGGIFDQLELKKKKIYMASNKYIGKIIKEMIENKYEE